jgi:hypothetical protein
MIVGEQPTVNLQRFLEQRLALGVLPLGVEISRQVGVAEREVGLVVAQQATVDLQRLLEQRLVSRQPSIDGWFC